MNLQIQQKIYLGDNMIQRLHTYEDSVVHEDVVNKINEIIEYLNKDE